MKMRSIVLSPQSTVDRPQTTDHGSRTRHRGPWTVDRGHTAGLRPLVFGGFTLMELMIVMALVGLVGTTIYSVFSSGVRIWDRLNQHSNQEDMAIFFENISRDVRNSFFYTGIEFEGTPNSLSFASILEKDPTRVREGRNNLGRVTYRLDPLRGALNRQEQGISQIYQEARGRHKTFLEGIRNVQFRYYYYDPVEDSYRWDSNWPPDPLLKADEYEFLLPAAIEVAVDGDDKHQDERYTKKIFIPAGQ